MTTIIITGVIALAVGFILGYLLINMTLKYRSKNIIKEAEAEAEVIKKDKILQAKEKFLQIKAEHEKQVNARNSKILLAENKKTPSWLAKWKSANARSKTRRHNKRH